MLNKAQLLQQLQAVSEQLFLDISPELILAQSTWQQLVTDPDLAVKIAACQAPWPLPLWSGAIDAVIPITPINKPYQLLSVDGSQVYPDKHQGTSCFLVNIGTVELQYGTGHKGIALESKPYVFTDLSDELEIQNSSVDLVNAKREELEFKTGLEKATIMQQNCDAPLLFLFDGSLIFWHLASKDEQLKNYFLEKYCQLLLQFQERNILIAGYISLPKSKDLVNVIRTVMCGYNSASKAHEQIARLNDSSIAHFFLESGYRSTLFKSKSPITAFYPESVAPYFLYADIGYELIRIELPAYLAHNDTAVSQIMGIILDQVTKGSGFPVGVAEAHEQAVVKGADRQFFYHLIEKLSISQKKHLLLSQKSRKKRAIAV